MPVLGPDFDSFERVNDIQERMIEAKERAAAVLAHNLLPPVPELSRIQKTAQHVGIILTGRRPTTVIRESVMALYEPDDDASEAGQLSMAALFSSVGGGTLWTRTIRAGAEPIAERLGPLLPRAVIRKDGYYGFPVVGLDEYGNEVFPSTLTLKYRELFVDQVSETLSIIRSQTTTIQPGGISQPAV